MRTLIGSLLVCAALTAGAGELRAQTRADSAAVLLHAAEQLRLQGEVEAARAVLRHIERQYAGTAAAARVPDVRRLVRGTPEAEESGRTELLVFGTTYGAWLGIALPLSLEADGAEAYGLGLLLGAPAGFLAAKRYADARQPTEGQAGAIAFGGSWGTFQGFGWAEVLGLGDREETVCGTFGCDTYSESDESTRVAAAVVGGLAGIGTGAWLARRPISAGTAAAVTLSGLWGTWFGWGLPFLAGVDGDRELLTGMMMGGNVALLAAGLAAPRWQMSESRARLISLSGVIGALGGLGLVLIIQPDDEQVAVSFPLAGSVLGLAAGVSWTGQLDEDGGAAGEGGAGGGAGALIEFDGGRWGVGTPLPSLRLARDPAVGRTAQGRRALHPSLHVQLLRASF